MPGFVNPLDSLGLPRLLVAEIWDSNRTQEQKVNLLLEAAKAQVRGLSRAIHDDVIKASGKEPLDHFATMNSALELFEDKGSVPAFVQFWLDPEETLRTRMYNQAQAAAEVRERRITALYSILGSLDRKMIKGVEGDFEAAVHPGINKQYAVSSPFLDNNVRGDVHILKAYGDKVELCRVITHKGKSYDSTEIPVVQLHDGIWKTLNGEDLVPVELRNPIAVRIVGGLDRYRLLDAQKRGIDPYRQPVGSYRHSKNEGAVEDERRHAAIDPTFNLHDFRWYKPEDLWWLEALEPEVEHSQFGHVVLMREDKDGEQLFAAFGLSDILDISAPELDQK